MIRLGRKGVARITAYEGGIFRVRITQNRNEPEFPSFAIVQYPPVLEHAATDHEEHFRARSDGWSLEVGRAANDMTLLLESPKGAAELNTPKEGLALALDRKRGITLRFGLREGVQYYGLGEFGEKIGRVPGAYRCWNTDDPSHHPTKPPYCCIPFIISPGVDGTTAHALFIDNPGEVKFELGTPENGVARITVTSGAMDMWLIGADSPAGLMMKWTGMTGRLPRPPLWALGFHQSRYSYMSADEVRKIADEFQKRNIPCSAIHLDIDYMDGYRDFTWERRKFRNPARLTGELSRRGIRTVTIVDPGIKVETGYAPYDEGRRNKYFLTAPDGKPVICQAWPGAAHFPDFTRSEVREWWGKLIRETLLNEGVGGIWCDQNEPGIWNEITPEIRLLCDFPHDVMHGGNGSANRRHDEIHNVYGICMAQAAYEGMVAARPNERPFVLTRSGWAGSQRYGAIWTGDNTSTHWSIPVDLTSILSLSACGVPFAGCDIGGFQLDTTPDLFTRWMELGAFLPFCRVHSMKNSARQEPWSFGPEVETHVRGLLSTRMELLPYIYTAFVECSETGFPVACPLWIAFPQDANCREIGDQFLLGHDIMVTPMYTPGVQRRAVYLPPGKWYPLNGGTAMEGTRWITAELPPGTAPLFVRAGAVVPRMRTLRKGSSETKLLLADVYPWTGPLVGALVQDDGITMDYSHGSEQKFDFSGFIKGQQLKLLLRQEPGAFVGFPISELRWKSSDSQVRDVLVDSIPTAAVWDAEHPLRISTENAPLRIESHNVRRCGARLPAGSLV